MRKDKPAPEPIEEHPQQGGSYTRNEDGSLSRVNPPPAEPKKEES